MADLEGTSLPDRPSDSVPVAPAVVVYEVVAEATVAEAGANELSTPTAAAAALENDQAYQYPVATFVSGFGNENESSTLQQNGRQSIVPLSVQSAQVEATNQFGLNATAATAAVANAVPGTVAARSVNDPMSEDAQFMWVDGTLVSIPPSNSMQSSGDADSTQAQSAQAQAQQPKKSRLHRGVRKLGKMFGRNKKKPLNQIPRGSSIESVNSLNDLPIINANSQFPSTMVLPGEPNNQGMTRQTSVGDNSARSPTRSRSPKTPQQRQKRRQRGSWRQRANSRDVGGNEEGSSQAGLQRADSDSREFFLPDDGQAAGVMEVVSSVEPLDALRPVAAVPPMVPIEEATSGGGRIESATATCVGTEFEVMEQAGMLPAAASAEVFLEYDFYDSDEKYKKYDIPTSLVPTNADLKVDKADAPDVESMLMRAAHETTMDLDQPDYESPKPRPKGKSDGSSVPLSQAKRTDKSVHNDILKVMLVGSVGDEKSTLARAIRGLNKRPKKRSTLGLDVHTWVASDMNFQLWDVQGATTPPGWSNDSVPNFGAHPATQSLFFSGESLYLLVWDLACSNPHAQHVPDYDSDSDDGFGFTDSCARELAMAEADRVLSEDISDRVLAWVDRIAQRAPGSAVLPVAVIPDGMDDVEAERRCSKMFEMLENHMKWYEGNDNNNMPNIVLDDSRNVLCVNFSQGLGIQQIQDTVVEVAQSGSVFGHIGTPVPPGAVEVIEYTKRVKQDHKIVRLDHIVGELSDQLTVEQIVKALRFLSNLGEVLYFGVDGDATLSDFVILSRQWLVSALSCILRNDLKREIADARKFMTMQCMYGHIQFEENGIIKALTSGATSDCPLLSDDDAMMLWQSMSFMREAADRYTQLNENGSTAPSMFNFLLALLVHFNVFLPFGGLDQHETAGLASASDVFFVPPLLSLSDPLDIWSFRSAEAKTTTLCHSWLFRDGTPPELFEHLTVSVLKDIYHFSQEFSASVPPERPSRAHTVPLRVESQSEFMNNHSSQSVGRVRIHHIISWKSALLLKISTLFPEKDTGELQESFVEIFVSIVDSNSAHCVASDAMRGSMKRVVVSGKGPSSLNGLKLYKGGYQAVLDSVKSSLASFNNVNMQIICNECLARGNPRRASTWNFDEVVAAAEERRDSAVICRRGHRVKSNLLCGICLDENTQESSPAKPVSELLESVVFIGLWDPKAKQIRSVGSGFIADKKLGLIVTAGHVVFNMEDRSGHFGAPYFGIQDAKIAIGVIPSKEKHCTVWRYFAEIVADDVRSNVDACVLRIKTRMESDVDEDSPNPEIPEKFLDPSSMKGQNLTKLKMETNFELEHPVRMLGFSQRNAKEISGGYIMRMYTYNVDDDSSSSDSENVSRQTFSPREEIVVRCPTIVGHSGGPVVNDEGAVVGLLSRVDSSDPHRCFLTPSSQLRSLVRRAKGLCTRPTYKSMM